MKASDITNRTNNNIFIIANSTSKVVPGVKRLKGVGEKTMLLIPNDTILHFCSICLVFCIALEVFDSLYFRRKQINESTTKPLVYNFPVPPVHYGCLTRNTIHMDVLSSSKYMPRNVIKSIMLNEVTKSDIVFSQKRVNKNSKPSTKLPVRAKHVEEVKAVNDCDFDDDKIYSKIMTVLPPGCEPYGPNANAMAAKFSQLTRPDIVRYLVARKGNVALAEEMAEKCLAWRAKTFPLKKEDVEAAMNTGCFFPHRTARDGSPVVYMRGGLYDNVVATPEQFVKAAAHAIEWSLQQHPGQINVTVIVHTVNIPGAPNLGADMNFIKQFVQVGRKINKKMHTLTFCFLIFTFSRRIY